MTSIKDIAKSLGVSVSTVSLALNDKPRVSEEMRKLIKQKAKEMNYVKNGIAADLQRKRTNIILFVVNDASRSFFSNIILDLQKATAAFGYDLLICTTYGNHLSTAKRFMEERRADAVIIYTSTIPDEMIQQYASEDFPIVVLGRNVEGENIHFLGKYPNDGILVTTEYLIQMGHKKIAFVKGSNVSLNTSRSFNRYKNTLEKYQIPFDQSIIYDAQGASYQFGYEITERMLADIHKFDAIQYSTSDNAIGGLMCLKEHGIRVPEDISVVGINNIPETQIVSPALTTSGTNGDHYLFYEGIVQYLILLLEKDESNKEIISQLKTKLPEYSGNDELVIRDSVKKI